ncbi:MAG: hypothetical protein ACKN9T_18440, partial [Candidatus Methylumidiphilus sp.]
YPAAIRAVVVGNEVLLRKEQLPAALRAYIERIKAALPGVPVTCAEPWEFWLRYQNDLLDAVSFATVHIIPYWENDPVGIGHAVGHVSQIYRHVKAQLHGKAVMIGETGWPSYGRQRQDAEATQVNQARFIREFAVRAEQENMPYNVIEAFDQPWKRNYEGAVGGHWGLYDAAGTAKFPFRGPVAEAPVWAYAAYAAMSVLFALSLLMQWRRRGLDRGGVLALLAVSVAGGGAWAGFCRDVLMASRSLLESAFGCVFAVSLAALILALGGVLAAWCGAGLPPPALASAGHLSRGLRRQDGCFGGEAGLLGGLRLVFLFGAALVCVLLVFDPGARDVPLALYVVPAVGFAVLAWIQGRSDAGLEEILLAAWIGFAGLWIAVAEHLLMVKGEPWRVADAVNHHALAWTALCLLLSGAVLAPALAEWRGRRPH